MDFLRNFFSQTLGLGTQKERLLDELTLEGVARYMQSERCRRVICLVGAGISTAAGIPDFRSPSTGLYANLEKYHLPYPEAIFEIGYFKKHPEPFFALAKELYPGQFKPTICHYFIRLMKEKGLLLRCYTQNIDTLERVAGLEPEDLVEAHGTFYTSHCISPVCRREYPLSWMKEKLFTEVTPRCEKCQSVVKPDIIFFGENLPARFFSCMQSDFLKVDLLIIMGTSLQVQPFASLVSKAPLSTPRLLINKEKTGQTDPFLGMMMGLGRGMDFDSKKAYRDVAWLGDCDQGCLALADLLGWKVSGWGTPAFCSQSLDPTQPTRPLTLWHVVTSDFHQLCPAERAGGPRSEGARQHRCPVWVGGLQPQHCSFPQEVPTSCQGGGQDGRAGKAPVTAPTRRQDTQTLRDSRAPTSTGPSNSQLFSGESRTPPQSPNDSLLKLGS
uniref:NAD-dependent protein deacetylase sirtuin-2 n=1 Tax=Urocitellus parryii TaxID=9999 RepID=A0A8D2KGF8_UROPR